MKRKGRRTREQYIHDLQTLKMRRAVAFLERMTDGYKQVQIAKQLSIEASTVKANLCWLYARLGARTNAQAVAIAFRKGLLK